jgi:hypothetical protein
MLMDKNGKLITLYAGFEKLFGGKINNGFG